MPTDDFFDGLDETKAKLAPRGPGVVASEPENPWRVLFDISNLFNSPAVGFEEILSIILDNAIRITGADRGFLMLFDEHDHLEVKLARNMNYAGLPEPERRVSQSIVEEVLRLEEGITIPNVEDSGKFSEYSSIISLKILSVICVPLKVTLRGGPEAALVDYGTREGRDPDSSSSSRRASEPRRLGPVTARKILGVIYVDSRSIAQGFRESALEVLQGLANNATTAIINATLYRQATTDEPTGLSTRRNFMQRLKEEVKLALRHRSTLAVVMVDLDEMRKINAARGYKEGDRVLSKVAEICRQQARSIDLAARYGGNKYTIMLPEAGAAEAEELARRISRAVTTTTFFPGDPSAPRVTVSIGCGIFDVGIDAEGLLQRADKALYQAKRDGRDRVRRYTPDLATSAKRTDRLAGVFSGDPSRDYRNCLMLLETIEQINKHTDLDELLPMVIDVIIDLGEAERGILLLRSEDGHLEARVARDRQKQDIPALDFSRSVVERVLELDQPVRETFTSDSALVSQSIGKLEIQAVMCVPLTIQDPGSDRRRPLGAIYLDRRERGGEFEESALAFFDTLARQISVAIENARLYKRNEELRQRLAEQLDKTKEELKTVRTELVEREKQIEHKYNYDRIIGKSARMIELFRLLDRITDTAVPVFIHGESGTGKELVANAIHYNGPRRKKRLVSENCAAMAETLLESELFGYVKGSFTGAVSDRMGLFEVANGGTLFLDEVGDMSMSMQKKLLRVLQEGEVRRVGGKETVKIDVRIISASNKDLKGLVEIGQFREDLYYRLNVVKVSLPRLGERKEDIPLLTEHFLGSDGPERPRHRLSNEAMQLLLLYHWPGNVRELRNVIERAKIIAPDEVIAKEHIILDSPFLPSAHQGSLPNLASVLAVGRTPAPGMRPPTAGDPHSFEINERQAKLVEYLRSYGSIRNRDYYEIMKVSKSTGWRDINDLINRSIIQVLGKGKGSIYTLANRAAEGAS